MSRGEEGGFLSRWSRRKQQARTGRPDDGTAAADDETAAPAGEGPAASPADDEAELSDAELLEKYELPDPETLTASDDVAAFMRKGVPARLRSMALRRMWRLDPVLANLDGLNDYDEDYTDAAMLAGAVKTVYQVGKGGAAHLEQAARQLAETGDDAGAALRPDDAAPPDGTAAERVGPDVPTEAGDGTGEAGRRPHAVEHEADTGAEPPAPIPSPPPREAPRRRHMVFAAPGGSGLHTDQGNCNN